MNCLKCQKLVSHDEQAGDMLCLSCRDNYMSAVVLTQAFICEGLVDYAEDYWEMNVASDSFVVKMELATRLHSLEPDDYIDFQSDRLQFVLGSIAMGFGVSLEDDVWLHSIGI